MTALGRRILALFAALALAGPAACAPEPMEVYAHPQKLVALPDGRRMNLYCLGDRGPTVILDAGLGGSTFSWAEVQPRLASRFRACSFDRAGMGFSDPGPMPRDARHRVEDLHALLKAARLPGPYILVGHSLGGIDVRLYAALHPKDMAGMVLVDPSVEHQDERMAAAFGVKVGDQNAGRRACLAAATAGLKPGTPEYANCAGHFPESWPASLREALTRQRLSPDLHRTEVSEFESLIGPDTEALEAAPHDLGALPLVVLTGENTYRLGVPAAYAEPLSRLWTSMHDEIARQSSRGVNRVVRGAGHLIQVENPVAVVTAIDEVAAQAKP